MTERTPSTAPGIGVTSTNAPLAGEYRRTGERCIRRLIAERPITYVTLGKHVRLRRSTLDSFIESGRLHRSPDVR